MNTFHKGLLQYLTPEQLETIQSQRIGIGGAGGLGSNVAITLTRCGFENIEILDFDVIEPSNLNRQQYFINEVGLPKVDVLAKRLKDINPDINLAIHKTKWSPETGNQFFRECGILIEAFDQKEWKHSFIEFYQDKAEVLVSGNGMAGLFEKKPMNVKKLGNIYFIGDRTTDAALGHPPMAPRVTICAAMMAEIVLDFTLTDVSALSASK